MKRGNYVVLRNFIDTGGPPPGTKAIVIGRVTKCHWYRVVWSSMPHSWFVGEEYSMLMSEMKDEMLCWETVEVIEKKDIGRHKMLAEM